MTFVIVLVGWVLSLSLHEFSHALVAYYGGDVTVKDKGYLTFNPIKYTHPVYSLLLPVIFLLLGGIGLPGGVVYIEHWRIRSDKWLSAMSLAGPLSNLLLAIVIGLAFSFTPLAGTSIAPALAFVGLLQVTAALFNLIPVPPFDGYNALRAHLPLNFREQIDRFSQWSMWIVLALFWYVPSVSGLFWGLVGLVASLAGIPLDQAIAGQEQFMFWR